MEKQQEYTKTISIFAVYEKTDKFGKLQTQLYSDLKEYYVTYETEGMIKDVKKGCKVELIYVDTKNARYKNIVKILRITSTTQTAKPVQASGKEAEPKIPEFPNALTDSEIDALMDSSVEQVADYFRKSMEEVKATEGLLRFSEMVFNAKLTSYKQRFQLAMAKREEVLKDLNFKRWKA